MKKEVENEMLKIVCNEYEKKLSELMGKEEFLKFTSKIGKTLILAEIQSMPDGDFKDLCIKTFSAVTSECDKKLEKEYDEKYGDN